MKRRRGRSQFSAVTLLMLLSIVAVDASAQRQRAPWTGETLDGRACRGGDPGNFGPYDYRIDKDRLPVVERAHFTPEVEQLIRGRSTTNAIGDINYTLVRFPNHHRALYSAVRFSLGDAGDGDRERYPAECYLQRAVSFKPNDPVPHMLYGLYLHRLGHLEQSLEKYQRAESLAPDDANLHYNMGLVYFDSGNYDESLRYAKQAYSRGMELPALQRRLQEIGRWE